VAQLLKAFCFFLILLGFLAIPIGGVVGMFSEGEGGSVTPIEEAMRMKAQARFIMLSGGVVAIGGFIGVYLIDRKLRPPA
jgi:hypothetical protein